MPSHQPSNSWIELDGRILSYNITTIKNLVGDTKIAAVIKANGYGHGLKELGSFYDRHDAIAMLCTFSLREALVLRSHGVHKDILVLGAVDDAIEEAIDKNICVPLYDIEQAYAYHAVAARLGTALRAHIKIDTGLSRLGFLADEALSSIKKIAQLPYLKCEGIFSHCAESDLQDDSFTRLQIERLTAVINQCAHEDIRFKHAHIANSSAMIRYAGSDILAPYTTVRVGGSLLGLLKPYIQSIISNDVSLRPLFTWKARCMQIKRIPAGSYVSYARTYQTEKDSLIGIVPVGYSDGIDRYFSNRGFVLVKGKKAPILGRVCMNALIVDLSALDHVTLADEVILVGNYPGLTPDDLAAALDTINYEVLTRINQDIPRIMV